MMKRTQIYLPQSQLAALRGIAHKKHTTMSGLIRQSIQITLVKNEEKRYKKRGEYIKSLLDLANELEKIGAKGPKDLASNVDFYLYGGPKKR